MPKIIHCEVWTVGEGGSHPLQHFDSQKTMIRVSRPVAGELSERENGRRILELAAEQLPTDKQPGHAGAR